MVTATPNPQEGGAVTWSQGSTHEPWRVGVLFSQSGVMAVIEETQLRAPLLAIDEIDQAGGVNAREIVLIVYNPESYFVGYGRLSFSV
jgi:ABC-type branched-subunit amino acid transport system substrate-binding protein